MPFRAMCVCGYRSGPCSICSNCPKEIKFSEGNKGLVVKALRCHSREQDLVSTSSTDCPYDLW